MDSFQPFGAVKAFRDAPEIKADPGLTGSVQLVPVFPLDRIERDDIPVVCPDGDEFLASPGVFDVHRVALESLGERNPEVNLSRGMIVILVRMKLPDRDIPGEVNPERGDILVAERLVKSRGDDIFDKFQVFRSDLAEMIVELAMELGGLVRLAGQDINIIPDPEIFQAVNSENLAEQLTEPVSLYIVGENTRRERLFW